MPDGDTLKLAAQYGLGGVFALALLYLLWKIGLRLIAAIDALRKAVDEGTKHTADRFEQLADRFDAHTKADVEAMGKASQANTHALGEVAEAIGYLRGKFDAVLEKLNRTPVSGIPQIDPNEVTQTSGVPLPPAVQPRAQTQPRVSFKRSQTSPGGQRIVDPIPDTTYHVNPKRGRSNG